MSPAKAAELIGTVAVSMGLILTANAVLGLLGVLVLGGLCFVGLVIGAALASDGDK